MATSGRKYGLSTVILVGVSAALLGVAGTAIALGQSDGGFGGPNAEPTQTGQSGTQPAASEEQQGKPLSDLARRIDGDPLALGAVNAPVVMIEYADYRCPFCSLYARDTLPALVKEFVADGTLRVEWRDLPIFGEDSVAAAVAGRAAGAQDKFWEFQAALHGAAPDNGHPDMPRELLIQFAEQAGVPDIAQFTADLDSLELLAAVQEDAQEATALGVKSTPTFVVGNEALAGAQPLQTFRDAILRQAGR